VGTPAAAAALALSGRDFSVAGVAIRPDNDTIPLSREVQPMQPQAPGLCWRSWAAGGLTAFGLSYAVWGPDGRGWEPWALVVAGAGVALTLATLLRAPAPPPADLNDNARFEAELAERERYARHQRQPQQPRQARAREESSTGIRPGPLDGSTSAPT
jgi:hypothetical protein